MKNFKTFIAILGLFIANFYSNAQTIRTYNLSGFQHISMGSAFHIKVSQGNSYKIIAKGEKKDLDKLEVYTKNNTLHAGFENNWSFWGRNNHDKVEFQIEMPSLASVDFSGASNSIISGFDDLQNLSVGLSGASKSKIDVFTSKINIDISGASNLKLIGRANNLQLDLSGASGVDATNFAVKSASIEASGASNAKVSVSESILLEASGASNIKYLGNPKVKKSTSGAASITKI